MKIHRPSLTKGNIRSEAKARKETEDQERKRDKSTHPHNQVIVATYRTLITTINDSRTPAIEVL